MTALRGSLKVVDIDTESSPIARTPADGPLVPQVVIDPPILLPATKPKRRLRPMLWSFLALVLLPSLAFGTYLFFVASDQYVAETRFAVRPVDPISGGDGNNALLSSEKIKSVAAGPSSYLFGGENLTSEDAEIVANYIHSRAIIDDVSRTVDLKAMFRVPEADVVARLSKGASAEDLAIYWNRMVSVYIETSSGIVTVSVSAFRREDALAIARAILASSEALVNQLSRKVRADAMKIAGDEVRRSDGEVRFALANLTAFRNSHQVIDPMQTSEASGKLLLQLMSDKIETEARLFVIERSRGPNAPGIEAVRAKLDSIKHHTSEVQDQMAGAKQVSKNLAATLAQFENLDLQKQFAERMYGFARDGVERARVAAVRQSVYLAVFMPPALPQDYSFPLRTTDVFLFAGACLMIWICGVTITASILDHRL